MPDQNHIAPPSLRGFDSEKLPHSQGFSPPPSLAISIREAVVHAPSSRSPLRKRIAFAALAIPLAVTLAPLLRSLFFGRPAVRCDLTELPRSEFLLRGLLVSVLALTVTCLALLPGRRGFGASARTLLLSASVVTPIYALATGFDLGPAAQILRSIRLNPWGLPCMLLATVVGSVLLTVFVAALRHAVPVAPSQRGAALGAAAGAWAGVALFVHCPAHDLTHLLVGHALPIAVFTLVGMLVAPRVLRP